MNPENDPNAPDESYIQAELENPYFTEAFKTAVAQASTPQLLRALERPCITKPRAALIRKAIHRRAASTPIMKKPTKEQGRPGKGSGPERASQHTAETKPTLASAQAAISATIADAEKRTGKPVGKMTAAEQAGANSGAGYQLLPVADIGRSPWNREEFDRAKMEELTDSVRERGVIQPILVRKNPGYSLLRDPDGGPWHVTSAGGTDVSGPVPRNVAETMQRDLNRPAWEIIAGERRWKAATSAQLTEIPAIVRIADDTSAIEEQAVENMQREDLNPIHEAEKYQQLLHAYRSGDEGNAMQLLCEKVQRSKALVYERIKLLKLPEYVREAIRIGRLPASHAALITKIDNADVQAEVAARILDPKDHETDEEDGEETGHSTAERHIMSYRNAKWIVNRVTREQEAKKAYEKARAEFSFAKRRILTDKEINKIMPYGTVHGGEFVSASDRAHEFDPSGKKTWAQLLGKNTPEPVLGRDQHGAPVIILPKKQVLEALKKAGVKKTALPKPASRRKSAEELARDRAHEARLAAFEKLRETLASKIEQASETQSLLFLSHLGVGLCGTPEEEIRKAFSWPEETTDIAQKLATATVRQLRAGMVRLALAEVEPARSASRWEDSLVKATALLGVTLPPWDAQTSGQQLQEAA